MGRKPFRQGRNDVASVVYACISKVQERRKGLSTYWNIALASAHRRIRRIGSILVGSNVLVSS